MVKKWIWSEMNKLFAGSSGMNRLFVDDDSCPEEDDEGAFSEDTIFLGCVSFFTFCVAAISLFLKLICCVKPSNNLTFKGSVKVMHQL